MSAPDTDLWTPPSDWRATTRLGELMDRAGVPTYDDLLELSIRQPGRYWSLVMEHLGFAWRTPYTDFVRTPDGPAFPRWFAGGRLNWVDNVLAHARGPRAQLPAVIGESEAGRLESLCYARLADQVLRTAAGLLREGVRHGDRVGLMMAMGPAAVVTFLAVSAIGAIAVPLFTGFGSEAALSRLRLAGATTLVASRGFERRGRTVDLLPVLRELQAGMPDLRLVLHGDAAQLEGVIAWDRLRDGPPLDAPVEVDAQTPFMVVFTSGTTGQPKGVVHAHGGFPLKILHDAAYHFDLRPGDRWLWPSDMGWIVGPITVAGALQSGATLVCYDGAPDHPTPARLAEVVDRHAVTHFGASPTLIRSLAASGQALRGAVLDSLRVLMVAGEVIDPEHFDWFFRHFGHAALPVINYSGGTEASGALLGNVPVRPIRAATFNSASPGVQVFAADAEGRRLTGSAGELVVGAPFIGMTQGFWNEPQRYVETYWSQRPGLWTHGDLLLERDGYFTILGRSDDTLKIAGKRVGPAEVEALALEHPAVREVAAIALPHAVKGEELVLCLTAQGPASAGLQEAIAARIERALGKPFRPAAVHVVDDLPRTRNGKVMRRVVRNLLRGLAPGDLSALENPQVLPALAALRRDPPR
jgi:acetyl-CoA synthetase